MSLISTDDVDVIVPKFIVILRKKTKEHPLIKIIKINYQTEEFLVVTNITFSDAKIPFQNELFAKFS